ncbi:STM4504/CBY_0614 family protein [Providencia manganoxydans]|uniref:STM4504/CBY_0614 family protein n=1 Tax=Providencia manganoxydans TaxID=2923283 RepID=UPI003AF3BE32
MSIRQIYSKRQKELRGEISDVYQYDELPNKLKIQIIHLIKKSFGNCHSYLELKSGAYRASIIDNLYKDVLNTLCEEWGELHLIQENRSLDRSYATDICDRLLYENNIEKCLDIVEVCFSILNDNKDLYPSSAFVDESFSDLNHRFIENETGYQFESGEIIRIDSQIMHSDVVKPVINLLSSNDYYNGANEEYLSAHEHYRHERYKECLTDCCKSFESMLKAIHEMNKWEYKKSDTASKLIKSCFDNELIPPYTQSQFTSLKTMLESGVPTIRNNMSGHGQGTENKEVNEELVSYMLHLTATNLLFLADSQTRYQQNNNSQRDK